MKVNMKEFCFIFLIIASFFLNSVIIAEGREGPRLAFEGGSFKPMYQDTEKDLQSSNSYGFSLDYQLNISQSFSFSILALSILIVSCSFFAILVSFLL